MNGLDVDAQLQQGAFVLNAHFSAPCESMTAIFGPSGSGKSTLLATIAGLKRPSGGRITLMGRCLDDAAIRTHVPAHRRGVGLVFQDARLLPHLSARQNLTYAQRRAPADRRRDVNEVANFFEIAGFLDRPVGNLSGGEKSRVALARSVMASPDLLLLDEPFAALDGARRHRFIQTLLAMHKTYALPMLLVTHDIDDAAALASQLVALRAGKVVAAGGFAAVAQQPAFQALLDPRDVGAAMPARMLRSASADGREAFWLRAHSVLLAGERPLAISARNIIEGRVAEMTREESGSVLVALQSAAGSILARVTPEAASELALDIGKQAWAIVKAHALF